MTEATDLPGLLSDLGITLKRMKPGAWVRTDCPQCHGGREKEECLAVKIDDDGKGLLYKCHRATCGWEGSERLPGAGRADGAGPGIQPRQERAVTLPPEHPVAVVTNKPPGLYRFFEGRKISAETVDWFGLYIARHWFPKHGTLEAGEHPAIVFPYTVARRVVNRKFRSTQKMFMQEKGALPSLYNIDSVTSDDLVLWCEGEADVMALHEAGYRQIVTLPNGAPAKLRDENDPRREDDERFAPLRTHAELLGRIKKFIIAGDMDEPGMVLREELARRLGRHRCWIVTWPQGCKDAGDVLQKHGPDAVRDAVERAKPYPIEGIQHVEEGTLAKLRASPPPATMTTGIISLDRVLKLPGEGRLIVVTGVPGNGKTSLVRYLMVHTAMEHGRRWQVFSPEMLPWENFAASVAEVLVGVPFWPRKGEPGMDADTIKYAESWISSRMSFLVSDAEDEPPTLDWILEKARIALLRDGITDLLIDPWNEIEHQRTGFMNEAEYLGRCLQRVRGFALRHGVNVWIIAHPTKLLPPKPGGEIGPPGLYDLNGGANWANKTDLAITVHTPPGKDTEVHIRKCRFARWGERGKKALVEFDRATGRYLTPKTELYNEEGE